MNRYETVFILSPDLTEDQDKEATGKFKKVIKDVGAKIIHEESWGLKKLTAPIEKKTTGYYHLFEYETDPANVKDIETALKRDERVIRYLTVRLDKHGNKPEGTPAI